MANLVLIHLGAQLPPYLIDAAVQARKFDPNIPIYLVGERQALADFAAAVPVGIERIALEDLQLSEAHGQFRSVSLLDRSFRAGFWTFTTERFFALERIARVLNLSNIIHIENDVMIYFAASTMAGIFASHYQRIASTFDSEHRCVPGLMFVRNADALVPLLDHINRLVALPDSNGTNDMELISRYRQLNGPDFIGALPIIPPRLPVDLRSLKGEIPASPEFYSNLFEIFGGVFDAAAIGQYFGGVDPRNTTKVDTRGFINETCIFNPSLYRFGVAQDHKRRKYPTIGYGDTCWPIYNLHVHSKNLRRFAS